MINYTVKAKSTIESGFQYQFITITMAANEKEAKIKTHKLIGTLKNIYPNCPPIEKWAFTIKECGIKQ